MLSIRLDIINNKVQKQYKLSLSLYLIILLPKYKIIAKAF